MGHSDLMNLHTIYEEIKRLNEKHSWNYAFKVDDGSFETRIDIDSDGDWKKGNGELPLPGYEIYCPDLIDFNTCTIIEYEEEAGRKKGAFGAKWGKRGHTEYTNTRDKLRDWYYQEANFVVLKIWESQLKDGSWKAILYTFLRDFRPEKRDVIKN